MKMSGRHSVSIPPPGAVHAPAKSGQVLVFLVMALVIITMLILWHVDLNAILHLKSRTQNAGDAAALAAARWQGVTLNLIGDLNIMQALALSGGDTNAAAQIVEMQARLRYMGPLVGLVAAQQAAKHNGIYVNAAFSAALLEHAAEVRETYMGDYPDEPWPGCWEVYAGVLEEIAGEGLAAAPDNTRRYEDYAGYHVLLDPDFYDAIAGQDWCWFEWYNRDMLRFYTDYTYWPALMPLLVKEQNPADSEIFGLGLSTVQAVLPGGAAMLTNLNELADERDLSSASVTTAALAFAATWTTYAPSRWTSWNALAASNNFPIRPLVLRPEYDYAGADAVARVIAEKMRFSLNWDELSKVTKTNLSGGLAGASVVNWTAAAKPFGYLDTASGPARPDSAGLVLPSYHYVRLVPADAASGPAGGAYDMAWRNHITVHLPSYTHDGLRGLDADCWYCRQLEQWEDEAFRAGGLDWLEERDEEGELRHPCPEPVFGPVPGGGTRRGH